MFASDLEEAAYVISALVAGYLLLGTILDPW